MANKSKRIGKSFENEVCDVLSSFFNLSFKRTFTSGAYLGGQNAHRMHDLDEGQIVASRGDIHMPRELSNLIIECKKRKEIQYHHFFQKDGSKELNSWIDQVEIDYKENNEKGVYFVVFKASRKNKLVCFPKKFEFNLPLKYMEYDYNGSIYIITEFNNDFLSMNSEKIKSLAKPSTL